MTPSTDNKKPTLKDVLEQRFDVLEKRILAILAFGITAIGSIIVILAMFINGLNINVNKQAGQIKDCFSETSRVKDDIGTMLLLFPKEENATDRKTWQKLVRKYNPDMSAKNE